MKLPAVAKLPTYPKSFRGRDQEVSYLRSLICGGESRLITVSGPPGAGKSRLVVEAVAVLEDDPDILVGFVDLTSLTRSQDLLGAIQRVCGVLDRESSFTRIGVALDNRPLILILDNFEHLLEAKKTVTELLEAYAAAKVVCTSSRPLNVSAEMLVRLDPLPTPTDEPTLEQVGQGLAAMAAVDLFVDRATPHFAGANLTQSDLMLIRDICQSLDGLPLAIEVVAPAVAVFPIAEILDRLRKGKPLPKWTLTDGYKGPSIDTAVSLSYDLLPPEGQRALLCLSVFRGGWTVEAAESILASISPPFGNPLEAIMMVLDANLIQKHEVGRSTRFSLFQTVFKFAESVRPAANMDDVFAAHARYYLNYLQKSGFGIRTDPETATAYAAMHAEYGNVIAAVDWAAGAGEIDLEARLLLTAEAFWYVRLGFRELKSRLDQLLSKSSALDPDLAAALRSKRAFLYISQDAFDEGETLLIEAMDLCAASHDPQCRFDCLHFLGISRMYQGRYGPARVYFEAAYQYAEAATLSLLAGRAAAGLGWIALEFGDVMSARRFFLEHLNACAAENRTIGECFALCDLAELSVYEGDRDGVAKYLQRAREVNAELRHGMVENRLLLIQILMALMERDAKVARNALTAALRYCRDLESSYELSEIASGLACVLVLEGSEADAARLFGAVESLSREDGVSMTCVATSIHKPFRRDVQLSRDQRVETGWAAGVQCDAAQVWDLIGGYLVET